MKYLFQLLRILAFCLLGELMKKNVLAILAGIAVGVVTSVGSILLLTWAFQLDTAYAVSQLPKSVTTAAIGVDVSTELGGISVLTTAVIILTGIVGNLLAVSLCKLLRITNPIATAAEQMPTGHLHLIVRVPAVIQ